MELFSVVYIDDNPVEEISRYLYETFGAYYSEITFNSIDGYESLLSRSEVTEANIILIDSKLFENEKVDTKKFSGEEFKMILKKIYPFIEVIVITQNDLEKDYGTIKKYRQEFKETPAEYYKDILTQVLDDAIKKIKINRNIANKLKQNENIDKVLIERVINSLEGLSKYEELTTSDIDSLIKSFDELRRELSGK